MEQTLESIYRSPDAEASVLAAYDSILSSWATSCEGVDVATRYGLVHVLVSGPTDGVPTLLFHASSMAAVSWGPNVEALHQANMRTYAVDYIGEAGRSVLDHLDSYPKKPLEIGQLYGEIADGLGIGGGPAIGASAGGHAAMRYALAFPERVTSLVLIGPMGIVPLGLGAVWRMMMASMFPSDHRVRKTGRWALGSAAAVAQPYGLWFETVLKAVASPPRVGRPVALTRAEMNSLSMPVLLVLGDSDHLVGNPTRAARKASAMPDLTVKTLHSSHLLGVERAQEVNEFMVEFLRRLEK